MSSRTDKSVGPNDRLSCDLALWELSAGLLDGVRDRLQGVQRIEGKHLVSERGNWHRRKILLASSRSHESFASVPETLVLTHHPKHMLVIGEGACEPKQYPKLPLICASELIDTKANYLSIKATSSLQAITKDLPYGRVAEGSIRVSDVLSDKMIVTTNWSLKTYRVLKMSGLEATFLVATNSQPLSEGLLSPPIRENNPKLTRQLGRLWGQLWSQPKQMVKTLKEPAKHWNRQRRIADQIELIVKQLD